MCPEEVDKSVPPVRQRHCAPHSVTAELISISDIHTSCWALTAFPERRTSRKYTCTLSAVQPVLHTDVKYYRPRTSLPVYSHILRFGRLRPITRSIHFAIEDHHYKIVYPQHLHGFSILYQFKILLGTLCAVIGKSQLRNHQPFCTCLLLKW